MAATLICGLSLAGCADDVDESRTEVELDEEPATHLGRVHLVLAPAEDASDVTDADSWPLLGVSARFAYFRGLEEDFVRARIDMPALPRDVLRPAQCIASEELEDADAPADAEDLRELVLADAGNMSVEIGDTRLDVPISLVPDLLPYMSGVAYDYDVEVLPTTLAPDAPTPVAAWTDGSGTDELPAFSVQGFVPIPLDLTSTEADLAELDHDILVIRWRPAGDPVNNVVLRLSTFAGSEVTGEEITCLFADRGSARLDMESVRALGLGGSGDGLQISASRVNRSHFDAGDLVGGELVVEVRDRMLVALP